MGPPHPPPPYRVYTKHFSTDLRKYQEGSEQKGVLTHSIPPVATPLHFCSLLWLWYYDYEILPIVITNQTIEFKIVQSFFDLFNFVLDIF